jgi:hypothetical protein
VWPTLVLARSWAGVTRYSLFYSFKFGLSVIDISVVDPKPFLSDPDPTLNNKLIGLH